MKLRYDFDSSHKTYRTFPQKVVHSTGLADRWSFLKWCCPFCLEKPRSRSRKSSSVPVIRITRPRSPDSDPDSEDEPKEQRKGSVESGGSSGGVGVVESTVRSHRANESGDVLSQDGSELDVIDEEINDPRDFDTDSILSKDSVRSKGSVGSKKSIKSKSSTADSVKSKTSVKGKHGKELGKVSKESFSSRESVNDTEGTKSKTRSSVKKIFKHFKRNASTASSTSSSSRGGDKRSSTKSSSSVGVADNEDNKKASKNFSPRAYGDKKRKSMTLDGRGRGFETQRSATSEVVGQEVELRGSRSTSECVEMRGTRATNEGVALRSNRSTTLDGRGSSRKGIIVMRDDTEPDGGTQVHRYKSTAKWETKTVGTVKIDPSSHTEKDNIEEMNGVAVKNLQTVDLETNGEGNSTPPTPPEKIEEDEVVFMSPKKFGMKGKTEKNKGNEEEEEQGGVREEERVGGMDEEEKVESCPPETPAQKDKVYDSPNKHHHHHHQVADPGDEPTSCGVEEGVLGQKSGSPSPLVGGTLGRTSGRDSVASSHASSTDTSCLTHPDEEIERLLQFNEKKITSLTPLGPTYTKGSRA